MKSAEDWTRHFIALVQQHDAHLDLEQLPGNLRQAYLSAMDTLVGLIRAEVIRWQHEILLEQIERER